VPAADFGGRGGADRFRGAVVFRTAEHGPLDEDLRTRITGAEYVMAFDRRYRPGGATGVDAWPPGERKLFVRIVPSRITGRRIDPPAVRRPPDLAGTSPWAGVYSGFRIASPPGLAPGFPGLSRSDGRVLFMIDIFVCSPHPQTGRVGRESGRDAYKANSSDRCDWQSGAPVRTGPPSRGHARIEDFLGP
jgi:hypothetical protein